MVLTNASTAEAQWPPEVPPYRRPGPPSEPPGPPAPQPAPVPILPSWEEPEPSAGERDVVDRLLEERIVLLTGNLDDASADLATARLLLLGRHGRDPIELHLTCPRSELDASLALADTVDLLAAPVDVVARGTLAGPVLVVLCAARQRVAHQHASFILSMPESPASGTTTELTATAEQHERQVERLRERIADRCGRSVDEVTEDLSARRLLSAEQARDYGLVDELR